MEWGCGGPRAGAGPGRMLRRPKVLTTVVPRHSNRPEIAVDVRPSTLDLTTAVTMPLAIASSAWVPNRSSHVIPARRCLTFACSVAPTFSGRSLIVWPRGRVRRTTKNEWKWADGGRGGGEARGAVAAASTVHAGSATRISETKGPCQGGRTAGGDVPELGER